MTNITTIPFTKKTKLKTQKNIDTGEVNRYLVEEEC